MSRYGLAELPDEEEEVELEELASRAKSSGGPPTTDLIRLLRLAMAFHIFQEPRPGFVAHTAASRLLRNDKGLKDYAKISYDHIWPTAPRLLDAIDQWPGSGKPNETVRLLNNPHMANSAISTLFRGSVNQFGRPSIFLGM